MRASKTIIILLIAVRLALGRLFVWGGYKKFYPSPKPQKSAQSNYSAQKVDSHKTKMRVFIGGMRGTDYFWQLLGVVELMCGVLLISQL